MRRTARREKRCLVQECPQLSAWLVVRATARDMLVG
jgi:hypothetical protein